MKAFNVKIKDTEKILFEGEVDRISSFNEMGPFDIYPMHANFISILRQELTLYKDKKKLQDFKFEQAVLKVKQDKAQIFLGIEVLFIEEIRDSSKPQN